MKTTKRPFKLSVLGVFQLETENMALWELLLIIIIVMVFVITIIILMKVYALPALGMAGIVNKTGLFRLITSRSP